MRRVCGVVLVGFHGHGISVGGGEIGLTHWWQGEGEWLASTDWSISYGRLASAGAPIVLLGSWIILKRSRWRGVGFPCRVQFGERSRGGKGFDLGAEKRQNSGTEGYREGSLAGPDGCWRLI